MFAIVTGKQNHLTERAVRLLAVDLAEAFGHQAFSIAKPGEWDHLKDGRHALSIITEYQEDGPTITPEPDEQFIQVHMMTRYYGIDYERGNLAQILSVADWMFRRLPIGSKLWYGGDSDGARAIMLDRVAIAELWDHYCKVGHKPYHGALSGVFAHSGDTPTCSFCADTPMRSSGGVRNQRFFTCCGCGARAITSPAGVEMLADGDDFFTASARIRQTKN